MSMSKVKGKNLVPDTISGWTKAAAGIFTVVVILWGGYLAFDAHWAKATELNSHIVTEQKALDGVKALSIQRDVRDLKSERFRLRQTKEERGRLTPLEKERLSQIEDELDQLNQQIKRLQGDK